MKARVVRRAKIGESWPNIVGRSTMSRSEAAKAGRIIFLFGVPHPLLDITIAAGLCFTSGVDPRSQSSHDLHKQAGQDLKKRVARSLCHHTGRKRHCGYYTRAQYSVHWTKSPQGCEKTSQISDRPTTLLGRLARKHCISGTGHGASY